MSDLVVLQGEISLCWCALISGESKPCKSNPISRVETSCEDKRKMRTTKMEEDELLMKVQALNEPEQKLGYLQASLEIKSPPANCLALLLTQTHTHEIS
ncbi:hypothetical protein F2P79_000609 [Pimephales promelas]|nr:hypothetical protein F2P79_000609 [Pimephales promelas]